MSLRNTLKLIRKADDQQFFAAVVAVLGVVTAGAVVGYYLLF
jgi:hypothetical protein